MTELRDGFLYHPDGSSPTDQLRRLVAGEQNLAFDDMFSTTQREAEEATSRAKSDHEKAVHQLDLLKAKIARLEEDVVDAVAHEVSVAVAIKNFEKTGEIDDILIPSCRAFLASERQQFDADDAPKKAAEIETASKLVGKMLGQSWDVADTHADEEFVYVTVKRRREVTPPSPRPTREVVVEKVKQAFEAHRREFVGRI